MDILTVLQYVFIVLNVVLLILLLVLLISRPTIRLLTTSVLFVVLLLDAGFSITYFRAQQQWSSIASAIDEKGDSQLVKAQSLMRELAERQARLAVADLTKARSDESFDDQVLKVTWRNELSAQLSALGSDKKLLNTVQQQINKAVLSFLFEDFSRTLVDVIGAKRYAALLKLKPREQWTDATFVQAVTDDQDIKSIMTETLQLKIDRWQLFSEEQRLLDSGI